MKNKKMMLVILVIVIIGLGSVVIPKLMKQQDTVKTDDVKIGVLQYVTHPALDEIYAGIKQGLSDEGYSKAKINFYNAQADQSKVTTMSGQLADQKNNVLIGIATPSVQGLANATSDRSEEHTSELQSPT